MLSSVLMDLAERDPSGNLALLAERYQDKLYNRAFRQLKNRQDAEDAVQQLFLGYLKNDHAPDINDPFCQPKLYVALDNKVKNMLKKRGRQETEDFPEDWEQHRIRRTDMSDEDLILLRDAVGRLPEDLRNALCMYYFYGYTSAEIAEKNSCSQRQVQRQIKSAKELLKRSLTE